MADGYARAMRAGIVTALKADAGVTAVVGQRIYSRPPNNVQFPYLHVASMEPAAFDTTCTQGALVTIGIVAYSRSPQGDQQAEEMAELVQAALHRNEAAVNVVGHNLIELRFQTFVTSPDDEGRGASSRIALEAMLEVPA